MREPEARPPLGGDGPVGKPPQGGREVVRGKGLRRADRTPTDGGRHLYSQLVAGQEEAGRCHASQRQER
jgi:hypothetical protein